MIRETWTKSVKYQLKQILILRKYREFIRQEKTRHLFYKCNNTKSIGKKALKEDKMPDYRCDKYIRKEINIEERKTELSWQA